MFYGNFCKLLNLVRTFFDFICLISREQQKNEFAWRLKNRSSLFSILDKDVFRSLLQASLIKYRKTFRHKSFISD